MQEDRTDLMVFIDLGFVLLVGFLILTETAPRSNVALPGDVEEPSEPITDLSVFNIHFNEMEQFRVENGVQLFCDLQGSDQLQSCMQQIVQNLVEDVVFVLIPTDQATVQQMVSILDLCSQNGWTCTIRN